MGTEDTPQDDDNESRSVDVWEAVHSLFEGAEVIINDRDREITVTNVRPNAEGGKLTEITLTGNQTTYTIRVVNEEQATPMITHPSASQSHPITAIQPAGETVLTSTTARDIFSARLSENDVTDTYPDERNSTPEFETDNLTYIGDCPCGCVVVEQQEKAICTGCGTWCQIEQWNAYHDDDESERNTLIDVSEDSDLTQSTFDSYSEDDITDQTASSENQ